MNGTYLTPKLLMTAIALLTASLIKAQTSTASSLLEKEFKNPPVSARPKALWPWTNGNVSIPQISFEMEEAKKKGMGGFDIWDVGTTIDANHVVPDGPAFLGKESVNAIAHAIKEGDRLGLEMGLIISSSWNAGGAWVKPEHGAMGLFSSEMIVTGPKMGSTILPFPKLPAKYGNRVVDIKKDAATGLPVYYKDVAILMHILSDDSTIIDTKLFSTDGSMLSHIDIPEGKWRIVRYVCAPTGQPLALPSPNSKGLMLDHFSAEAQQYNLDYIFKQLLPVTGPLNNRSLKYLYTDSYEVNSAVWTSTLPEEFEKRNHYRLEQYLPVLDGFTVGNKELTQRFLFDFRKTLSDLIIENHYKLGKDICATQGLGFVAEAGGPGPPVHNVPFEDLKALGALTIPRGEFWNKHPDLEILQIVKGIASASHIYNQRYVEAEAFTSVWLWQEGPDELKPLADRAMCEGLNRFVYHTFPHTPPASGSPGWVYNFGTLINTTNGWWPKSQAFHEYLARSSYLLQQGNFVGDVAFYYGDKAPNFVSPKHIPASLGAGYDYDVVNTDVILNKMQVKDGKIFLPHGQYYEVLVLPDTKQINPAVLQKLEELVRAGATVIGPRPSASYGLNQYMENDKLVQVLADRLWGNCDSVNIKERNYGTGRIIWGRTVREVLKDRGVSPDIESGRGSLDFIHRSAAGAEIYFLRNTSKMKLSGPVSFRIKGMQPEIWNAETGEIIPVSFYDNSGNGTSLYLSLDTNASCFVLFRKDKPAAKPMDISLNGKRLWDSSLAPVDLLYGSKGLMTRTAGKWKSGSRTSRVELPAPILLNKPWILDFEIQRTGMARDTMKTLLPLNQSAKDAIKFYSGLVVYTTRFKVLPSQLSRDLRLLLELGKLREIAEVFVNGKKIGFSWHAPWSLDITEGVRAGENELRIEIVNSVNNRLVGDSKLPSPYGNQMKSNITKLPNAWRQPFAQAALLDAGLIGPVQIQFAQLLK